MSNATKTIRGASLTANPENTPADESRAVAAMEREAQRKGYEVLPGAQYVRTDPDVTPGTWLHIYEATAAVTR